MRVLWIKSDFPIPADTGGKIRTRHLLVELAKRADVTFLSYAPPGHESKSITALNSLGVKTETIFRPEEIKQGAGFHLRVLANVPSDKPYTIKKYISQQMIDKIRELARPDLTDVVLCDFLEMAWCRDYVKKVPTVLFEHNVESMIWRRYYDVETSALKKIYFAFEMQRMARYEAEACQSFDHILTVSEQDGQLLRKEFGLRNYTSLPTGVDTEFFQPWEGEISGRLVFCGSMDWMPNIDGFWWFYREIYNLVKNEVPAISFSVVGRRPGDDIKQVAGADPTVIITGTVDDVRPHVAAGQLYVVPLRVGGGTRIKIYEAMAMKKCVISTRIGAEGLPLIDGKHIVLADSEREFADRIKELLRDDNKRHSIAEAGYRLVTENYGWGKAAEILHSALQSVARKSEPVKA